MKKRYKKRTDAALTAYGLAADAPNEPLETNLIDLLADMLHRYAADPDAIRQHRLDEPAPDPETWVHDVVRSAINHYRYEASRA